MSGSQLPTAVMGGSAGGLIVASAQLLPDELDVTFIGACGGVGAVVGAAIGAVLDRDTARWAGYGSLWGGVAGIWIYTIALLVEVL